MLWTEDGKKGSEGIHWKVKWFLCFTSKHQCNNLSWQEGEVLGTIVTRQLKTQMYL